MTETRETEHADYILSKRWPDALIGDTQRYGGPINGRSRPQSYILTEQGWEPLTSVPTIQAALAKRERHARETIDCMFAGLDGPTRQAVIAALTELVP